MEHVNDGQIFLAVLCLPLLVRLVMWPRVRGPLGTALRPVAVRVWQQQARPEDPDAEMRALWDAVHHEQLQRDLERVGRLLVLDEWMSGTRQLGNRLAYAQLSRDVRQAQAYAVAARVEPRTPQTCRPVPSFVAPGSTSTASVEIMEFGPGRRRASYADT